MFGIKSSIEKKDKQTSNTVNTPTQVINTPVMREEDLSVQKPIESKTTTNQESVKAMLKIKEKKMYFGPYENNEETILNVNSSSHLNSNANLSHLNFLHLQRKNTT